MASSFIKDTAIIVFMTVSYGSPICNMKHEEPKKVWPTTVVPLNSILPLSCVILPLSLLFWFWPTKNFKNTITEKVRG